MKILFTLALAFLIGCVPPPQQNYQRSTFETQDRIYQDDEGYTRIQSRYEKPDEKESKKCKRLYDKIEDAEDDLADAYDDLDDAEDDLEDAEDNAESNPVSSGSSSSDCERYKDDVEDSTDYLSEKEQDYKNALQDQTDSKESLSDVFRDDVRPKIRDFQGFFTKLSRPVLTGDKRDVEREIKNLERYCYASYLIENGKDKCDSAFDCTNFHTNIQGTECTAVSDEIDELIKIYDRVEEKFDNVKEEKDNVDDAKAELDRNRKLLQVCNGSSYSSDAPSVSSAKSKVKSAERKIEDKEDDLEDAEDDYADECE